MHRRLRIEPTQKISVCRYNRGKGGEFEVPQVKQKQRGGPGSLHHRVDIFTIGNIPGKEREVIKGVTLVFPDQLNLGPCFAATAARAREVLGETLW